MEAVSSCTIVSDLLTRLGVPEKSWASTLAQIMGGHYQTAARRLANQEKFTLEELLQIAEHFNTTVSAMLATAYPSETVTVGAVRATLMVDGDAVGCQIVTKAHSVAPRDSLVAYQAASGWVVCPSAKAPVDVKTVTVVKLLPLVSGGPLHKVAVVDDEAPTTLVRFLTAAGFSARHYTDTSSAEALLGTREQPDAYVLDWTMSEGRTSRELIDAIRRVDKACPIVLLTGTIQSQRASESEIAHVCGLYNLEFFEKPTKFTILAERLRVRLDRPVAMPA